MTKQIPPSPREIAKKLVCEGERWADTGEPFCIEIFGVDIPVAPGYTLEDMIKELRSSVQLWLEEREDK